MDVRDHGYGAFLFYFWKDCAVSHNDLGNVPSVIDKFRRMYFDIFNEERSERKVQRRPNFEQNRKLLQSLLTVIVVFWLTWLPFTICTIRWIYPCKVRRCRRCPLLSLNFLKVLHYSNSFANPIIYAIGLPGFRSTIKQTFCKRKRAML